MMVMMAMCALGLPKHDVIVPGAGNRGGHRAAAAVDHENERRGGEFRPLGPLAAQGVLCEDAQSWVMEERPRRLREL